MRHAGQQGRPGVPDPVTARRDPYAEGEGGLEDAPQSTPAPVRVVVIGAGKVAHAAHLREIRDLPHLIRPVAVIEPDPGHRAALMAGFPRVAVCTTPEESVWAGATAALTEQERWLLKYSQPAKVKVVGVWDTVNSVGIAAGNIPGISRSQFDYLQS